MKNKIKYKLIVICLLLSCSGCDVLIDYDSKPVSAQIDGVLYQSVPELYPTPHTIPFSLDCQDTFFEFRLYRSLFNDDVRKHLVLKSRIHSDLEMNKKYDIKVDDSYMSTFLDNLSYSQDAVSGWIMFTDILPNSSTKIHVMGKFEVIFEGAGDQKETLLTNGYFGPGTCDLSL